MGTPLNLVPELLMVLGAATSSMCSICHTHIHTAFMMRGSIDTGGHTGSVRVNGASPTVVCSGSHVDENVWAVKEIRPDSRSGFT